MPPGAAILVLAGALAIGVVWYPIPAVIAAASVTAIVSARYFPTQVQKLFLRLLGALLASYALFGRTFAGLGMPPVYIGEIVLGVGILTVVATGWRLLPRQRATSYLLLAFMGWSALQTIPYLGIYGLDAVRDAVLWGYGLFALLLAPLLLRDGLVDRIPNLYARLLPWIVLCAPAWVVFCQWTDFPGIPGTAMGVADGSAGLKRSGLGSVAAV